MKVYVLCLVVSLVAVAGAQQKPAEKPPAKPPAENGESVPTLSEQDALKLDNGLLRAENLQLQIQTAQQALEKVQAELQVFAKSLEKPGYTLTRGQDGKWVYTVAKPGEKPGGQ